MGQFDQVIDWFKQHHDALIDDLAPLQSGLRNVMEFDGSEWRDVTPTLIAETRGRIAELELLVRIMRLAIIRRHPSSDWLAAAIVALGRPD